MSDNENLIADLLPQWQDDKKDALDNLIPLLYDELRMVSRRVLQGEKLGFTLSPTSLVHEVYFKLMNQNRVQWQNRAHFLAVSAQLMRRILLNYITERKAQKRGGGLPSITLDQHTDQNGIPNLDLVALDEALVQLQKINERASQIVVLRFFGGLTEAEMADVLAISESTIRRDWTFARTWLFGVLKKRL